jgi:hypothetical protein
MEYLKKYLTSTISLIFINLISTLSAFWTLGLSPLTMNTPWVVSGDLIHSYVFAQNIKDTGSFAHFANLAWPFVSDLSTFPTFDLFQFMFLKIFTNFFNPIFSVNLYVIFTFPLITTINYFLFRKIEFKTLSSSLFAILLSLIPWHYQQAIWHVNYANYVAVPLTLLIVYYLIDSNKIRLQIKKMILLILLITTLAPYFWIFSEIILIISVIYLFVTKKIFKAITYYVIIIAIIPIVKIIELFTLKSQSLYVGFSSPVERDFGMVEKYSGSFMALFMPSPHSLIPFFSHIRSNFDHSSNLGYGEGGPWNSIIGIIALIFTLLLFIQSAITEKVYQNKISEREKTLFNIMLLLFFVTLLFYWTTGLGSIFVFFVSDWVRSWGRLFIFLIYFAFLVFVLFLKKLYMHNNRSKFHNSIFIFLAISVLIFDQIAKPIPNRFLESKSLYAEMTNFSLDLNSKIHRDCSILQLPIMKYPAGEKINKLTDYEHFLLYLANPDLKFSYGSVLGTQQDMWQEKIETKDLTKTLAQAAAVGYCLVVVDFRGYESTVETGNAWIKAAGKPIAVSKNARLAAFKVDSTKSNSAAIQSLVTLNWKGKAELGVVQGSKQIDFYDKSFNLYALNPTKYNVKGQINFGVRGSKCSPTQQLMIKNSKNEIIFKKSISKNTQQVSIDLDLGPRQQSNYNFGLSSSKCTIEWFSDALISIRNERFVLN